MGTKDCFYVAEIANCESKKIDCVSLEPPGFRVTFVVVFCVLISRHMRKSGSFAGKEHVE